MYENDNEKIQRVKDELNQKIDSAKKEIEIVSKALSMENEYLNSEKEETKDYNKDRKKVKSTNIKVYIACFMLGCAITLVGCKYAGSKIVDMKVEKAKEEFEDTMRISVACIKLRAIEGESIPNFNKRISKYFGKVVGVDTSSTNGKLYIDRGYNIYNEKLSVKDSNVLRSLTYIHDTTTSKSLREYLERIFDHEFTMTTQDNLDWNPIIREMNKICIDEKLPLYRMSENGELLLDGEKVPELDVEYNVLAMGKKNNNFNKGDTLEQTIKENKEDNSKQGDEYFSFTIPDEWFFPEENTAGNQTK